MIDLSIIIVSYNVREYLLRCIASVKTSTKNISFEIVVVDNNSSDGSADAIERNHPDALLVRNKENVGFAKANNSGYERCSGEFILLLNPDTEVKAGSIERVLEFMKKEPGAGAAGCRIVKPDGALQKSIHPFASIGRNIAWALFINRLFFREQRIGYYYRNEPFIVDSISGAFMMVQRTALSGRTLLNPDYFMYSEEKDLCLRLKRSGWPTWFVPDAEIVHYRGKSTSQMPVAMFLELQKSQVVFFRNFYSKGYALALCLTWWLVLSSSAAASAVQCYSRSGRDRIGLFMRAATVFPAYISKFFFAPGQAGPIHHTRVRT